MAEAPGTGADTGVAAADGSTGQCKNLTYKELIAKMKIPNALLIDVRGADERNKEGKIPGSKNIPVDEIAAAFKLDNAEFKAKFGFDKPSTKDRMIFHCKAGTRAGNAAKILSGLGYNNVEVYPGCMDWTKNGGTLEKLDDAPAPAEAEDGPITT